MSTKFDEDIDKCITSLKLIGMIPKNGRLCCNNGELAIDVDDRFQTIRRWFNRSTRTTCILQIRGTIVNATEFVAWIISKKINIELENWTLQQLLKEMTNCQSGLGNLKTTYHADRLVIAKIDVLLERLQENCKELETYLSSLTSSPSSPIVKSVHTLLDQSHSTSESRS